MNITKNKRIIVLVICCIFLVSGICFGIGIMTKNKKDIVLRVEKDPILNRFPMIGSIEKCYWKADVIGKQGLFSAPAPSSYWMKGYVFLNMHDIENLKAQYDWLEVDIHWHPSLDESILNLKNLIWFYSEDYNNFIKPSKYFGKFYVNFENAIVYFEVEE